MARWLRADIAAFTRRICDRHDGVGADGVEWMFPHFTADVEIRLINADGSAAEISGNGTRCVAAYLCAELGKERISILTGAGIKICTLTSRSESEYEFEIEMGEAAVEDGTRLASWAREEVRGIPVSMGNPHYVSLRCRVRRQLAGAGGRDPAPTRTFQQGVNVELVVVDEQVRRRGPLFRARRRRNAVFRHRFLRVGRGRDGDRPAAVAGQGARARRHADGPHGRKQSLSARSGAPGVPGRVFLS